MFLESIASTKKQTPVRRKYNLVEKKQKKNMDYLPWFERYAHTFCIIRLAWLTGVMFCFIFLPVPYLPVSPLSPGTCSGHSDSSVLTGCTCPSGAVRGLWGLVTCSPIIHTWPAISKRLQSDAFCLRKNRVLNGKLSFPKLGETRCLVDLDRTFASPIHGQK